MSNQKKLVFAAITTAGFFLLLELALGLLGVEPASRTRDPMAGFSGQLPLMNLQRDASGNPVMRTAKGKLVWFNSQSFPARKAPGTRRVFCVGGSTTYGRPFNDLTSYCGWLRQLLPLVDDTTRWEVINAGGVSYASYRVAVVMEELARYEPDLFIVYTAHNEFLERRTYHRVLQSSRWRRDLSSVLQKTRIGTVTAGILSKDADTLSSPVVKLTAEVDEILNHSIGPADYTRDDPWQQDVLKHFEWNLARMISIARDSGAEIVFVTPASNLRDCQPFKTEVDSQLGRHEAAEMQRQLERVATLLGDGSHDQALDASHKILAIDPRNADAHFHCGTALLALGRYDHAKQAFGRAVDEDVCPLRATSHITEAIRRIADQRQVPVVDFKQRLELRCRRELGHDCFGHEYFYDHVHPTIDVHRDLALWILATLQRQSWVDGPTPRHSDIDQVQQNINRKIDVRAQGSAFRNLAKVMHWAGRWDEAARSASDALRLIPEDIESRYVLAACLAAKGKGDEALAQYEQLFAVGDYPRAYLPVAELLVERGRWQEAKSYLVPALVSESGRHPLRAYYLLGGVHLQLGEPELALELFNELNRVAGDDPETLLLTAQAHFSLGDPEAGVRALRRVIELDQENAEAHYRLGVALRAQDRLDDARRHVETAIELDPSDDRGIAELQAIRKLEAASME